MTDRTLVFLDIESTGVDPVKDRIVELAYCVVKAGGEKLSRVHRFNPGVPIPAEATAVHGITDADVAGCPPFSEFAAKVAAWMVGKDLAGYNLRKFDLPILDEELRRCGFKLDLTGARVIDCFGIFAKKEPRKLEDAVRRYCGREHTGAHGALADVEATADVYAGQIAAYPELASMGLGQLAEFSRTSEHPEVDLAGKLYRDADGDVCFAFGKHRGEKVREHADYADWMLTKGNFPGSTCESIQEELKRMGR